MTFRRRLGRFLCRHSFHKWHQADAVDRHADEMIITSYAWCEREGCDQQTVIVNIEKHWIPEA